VTRNTKRLYSLGKKAGAAGAGDGGHPTDDEPTQANGLSERKTLRRADDDGDVTIALEPVPMATDATRPRYDVGAAQGRGSDWPAEGPPSSKEKPLLLKRERALGAATEAEPLPLKRERAAAKSAEQTLPLKNALPITVVRERDVATPAREPPSPVVEKATIKISEPVDNLDVSSNSAVSPAGQQDGAGTRDGARRQVRQCPTCGSYFSSPDVCFCPFDGHQVLDAPNWDPSGDALIGRTVSVRYQVEAVVAEGSMGTVYRVRHTKLGTAFAMKVLRRDLAREEQLATRLVDEARATAAIGHPNIVAVTDFGEIDSSVLPDLGDLRLPYFVMELLVGKTLAEVIREEGSLRADRIARLMAQCASALGAAHEAGIIHRDLKPGNIRLVSSEPNGETAKIVDFGVAKIIGSSRKTLVGVVFGTPHYMSPEQGRGHAVDQRTDIYALGVIMYECLTGRVPFEADTYMGVVTKHLFKRPEPIATSGADPCSVALEPVVMRCLAKEPAERFASMAEVAEALTAALNGGEGAPRSSAYRARGFRLRDEESAAIVPQRSLSAAGLRSQNQLIIGGALLLIVGALCAIALRFAGVFGPAPLSSGTTQPRAAPSGPMMAADRSPNASAPLPSPETSGPSALVGASTAGPAESASGVRARPAPTAKVRVSASASSADHAPVPKLPPTAPHTHQSGGDVVDPWSK